MFKFKNNIPTSINNSCSHCHTHVHYQNSEEPDLTNNGNISWYWIAKLWVRVPFSETTETSYNLFRQSTVVTNITLHHSKFRITARQRPSPWWSIQQKGYYQIQGTRQKWCRKSSWKNISNQTAKWVEARKTLLIQAWVKNSSTQKIVLWNYDYEKAIYATVDVAPLRRRACFFLWASGAAASSACKARKEPVNLQFWIINNCKLWIYSHETKSKNRTGNYLKLLPSNLASKITSFFTGASFSERISSMWQGEDM